MFLESLLAEIAAHVGCHPVEPSEEGWFVLGSVECRAGYEQRKGGVRCEVGRRGKGRTNRSARANPYAERMELYRWMRIVLIPMRLAISQACWPPAPLKLTRL